MQRIAFTMQLNQGQAEEYQKRHDQIWPELVALLKDAGVQDYSIFLDPESHIPFATLLRSDEHAMDQLPDQELMQKWWAFMGRHHGHQRRQFTRGETAQARVLHAMKRSDP